MSTTPSTTSTDRRRAARHAAAAALAIAAAWSRPGAAAVGGSEPAALSDAQVARISSLLIQDCGSCHGLRMTGGLGPALTPDTLRDKPRESLITTILQGRPGTPMPPWNPFLSPAEAGWIIDHLIEGQLP